MNISDVPLGEVLKYREGENTNTSTPLENVALGVQWGSFATHAVPGGSKR
jgi:hypothetical protein